MANLRRPYSKDKDSMFNVNGGRCKRHPKHVQSPGVCSLCLKDKLDQLSSSSSSSSNSQKTNSASCSSSSSSLSSYYSSSSGSSCSSPMHDDGSGFSTIFLFHKHGGGLVKSKSMAVLPRRRNKDTRDQYSKKSGFWFNLFHPNYKNKRMVTVAS
ncbi:unnamed protein product [Lathyrus sativus]|nr:unnamed protein product [Lathyrus sativus]